MTVQRLSPPHRPSAGLPSKVEPASGAFSPGAGPPRTPPTPSGALGRQMDHLLAGDLRGHHTAR
jgi:hypothetical protein